MGDFDWTKLPRTSQTMALWMDPDDDRCGFVLDEFGTKVTIGKARINAAAEWDATQPWQLVQQHRGAGLKVPVTRNGVTTLEPVEGDC